jgi:hypothetical protein
MDDQTYDCSAIEGLAADVWVKTQQSIGGNEWTESTEMLAGDVRSWTGGHHESIAWRAVPYKPGERLAYLTAKLKKLVDEE